MQANFMTKKQNWYKTLTHLWKGPLSLHFGLRFGRYFAPWYLATYLGINCIHPGLWIEIINSPKRFQRLLKRAGRYISGWGLRGRTGKRILSNERWRDGESTSGNHCEASTRIIRGGQGLDNATWYLSSKGWMLNTCIHLPIFSLRPCGPEYFTKHSG